jgi:haloalkane dehalogenase
MLMTRHYITINGRSVHYRRAGNGPPVLLVHQSPRSSAEFETIMQDWGQHFTCIAPDTPGFGQSDPLNKVDPDIYDFADALAEFVGALGLEKVAAYGFHSGAICLIAVLRRYPDLFTAIAAGGYAIWNDEERARFGPRYAPPYCPQHYGEHLIWMWNRVLEQSWFFPWYDVRPETRMKLPKDDPQFTARVVQDLLDAQDGLRVGYTASLQARSDIPPVDAITPPVMLSTFAADPLAAHLHRTGALPKGWSVELHSTPQLHHAANRDFLLKYAGTIPATCAEDQDQGFVPVSTSDFEGLIHWKGMIGSRVMTVPAPGSEADLVKPNGTIVIDPPGHGLSSSWKGDAPTDWASWQAVLDAAAKALGTQEFNLPSLEPGDPDRLFPDLTPDRFGTYLVAAWAKVRAQRVFSPWYEASVANEIDFDPADLDPSQLALHHRALIRGVAAKSLHLALAAR